MIKINIFYSETDDIKRVSYTIDRWDFYMQHYNVSWIKLPVKLDREKIKDYSKEEIEDSIKEEYLNNSKKIYEKVEQEILSGWGRISEKIEAVSVETGIEFPKELNVQLTCYGMGGSYYQPNRIILLAVKFNLLATIVHELIHLGIEGWIQKFNVGHPQKERIVDLFMSKYFSDLFPERVVPKFSQQVYQNIDYHKIDEVFEKFQPNMEVVVKEVSEI